MSTRSTAIFRRCSTPSGCWASGPAAGRFMSCLLHAAPPAFPYRRPTGPGAPGRQKVNIMAAALEDPDGRWARRDAMPAAPRTDAGPAPRSASGFPRRRRLRCRTSPATPLLVLPGPFAPDGSIEVHSVLPDSSNDLDRAGGDRTVQPRCFPSETTQERDRASGAPSPPSFPARRTSRRPAPRRHRRLPRRLVLRLPYPSVYATTRSGSAGTASSGSSEPNGPTSPRASRATTPRNLRQ